MANDHFGTYFRSNINNLKQLTAWDVPQVGEVGLILLSFSSIDICGNVAFAKPKNQPFLERVAMVSP